VVEAVAVDEAEAEAAGTETMKAPLGLLTNP
jgi:hypothetical protein